MPSDDIDRLRAEYARRGPSKQNAAIYSYFDRSYAYTMQQRQRQLLDLLRSHGTQDLRGQDILEIGCGRGGVLLEWLTLGASPANLYGIDLLDDRLHDARQILPNSSIVCGDGQALPYSSRSFDIILQYTALSSILDGNVKRNIAREMVRVLQPKGIIIWYDFWLNPTNAQTKGIRPTEIRALYPECNYDFRRVTLAPPLARRLVPFSWIMCSLLEKLGVFNSHYLVLIRRK